MILTLFSIHQKKNKTLIQKQAAKKENNLAILKQIKAVAFIGNNQQDFQKFKHNFLSFYPEVTEDKLSTLLNLYPFNTTEKTLRNDFLLTLSKKGWLLREDNGNYNKKDHWLCNLPSSLRSNIDADYEEYTNQNQEVNADYVANEKLGDFILQFGKQERLLFDADYIINFQKEQQLNINKILIIDSRKK